MSDQTLIELVASAWRELRPDGTIASSPAWHDLDAEGRVQAFEHSERARLLEASLDPQGLSSTAHAVLARIRG